MIGKTSKLVDNIFFFYDFSKTLQAGCSNICIFFRKMKNVEIFMAKEFSIYL